MKKSTIKQFEQVLGKITPIFSSAEKKLFVDSDISGVADANRTAKLITLVDGDSNSYTDLLLEIQDFEFEGRNLKGKIYLDVNGTKKLLAEPQYTIQTTKVKFTLPDLKSYIQEIWLQALNEYKNSLAGLPLQSSKLDSNVLSKFNFGNPKTIGATFLALCFISFLSYGAYTLGNKSQGTEYNASSLSSNPTQDGKEMALKNLGINPNAVEFDNSCFTEK